MKGALFYFSVEMIVIWTLVGLFRVGLGRGLNDLFSGFGETKQKKMKNETKTNVHAQRAGRVLRVQGCCLLVVRSVSPMMCPSDGQQKYDEKGQTEDKPR